MPFRFLPPQVKSAPFPELFNAKRQIQVSKGLTPAQLKFFRENPVSEAWRNQVSPDVVDFVDKTEARDENGHPTNELLPEEKLALFKNPVKYFSRPHNVPDTLRQQVYFPNFGVTLLRTPHLGPRYAQFKVPLWFGKLDLKSYLKNLYSVDVTHIRSFVVHRKKGRRTPANRYSRGERYQPSFKKKMTVHLVEPFVWPAEPTAQELNGNDYQKKQYWDANRLGVEAAERDGQQFSSKPNEKHRKSIAQQAQDLLAGRTQWRPTWQQMPEDVRVLQSQAKSTELSSTLNRSAESPAPL